jgi:serine/threonine protein kinase
MTDGVAPGRAVRIQWSQANPVVAHPEELPMSVFASVASLALRPILDGASQALFGLNPGERTVEAIANFILQRFTDQSTKLLHALHRANDQAWRSLEIALAGETLLSRLDRADQKAFREQVRQFLEHAAPKFTEKAAEFRTLALKDLRAARGAGVLVRGFEPKQAADRTAAFARYTQPAEQLDLEWQTLGAVAETLREQDYTHLARFLEMRFRKDAPPLLAVAVRFFFRREVENDEQLFQGVVYQQIDQLGQALQAGFGALHGQAKELRVALDGVQEIAAQTHAAVLDVQGELQQMGAQHRELYQQVLQLHQKLDLQQRELQPRDSLSIRGDAERQLVKQLVGRYRALPEEQRRRLPALLNAIGKLEVAAGDFKAAEHDFSAVLACVTDAAARGEAHYNAYLTLLEQRRHDEALARLTHALACDANRFAPFPLDRYEPQKILGAGGFGVTFLCKYRLTGGQVAVKVLLVEGLERDVRTVFQEAAALDRLSHPAIIGLRECGFADAEQRRPYLVMNYFEGLTLDQHVAKYGPLTVPELVAVARAVAEALQAAHASRILHRDVKPANVLVRRDGDAWQVKLIDFGLALKQAMLTTIATRSGDTARGASIAGTLDYAAPEQLGRLPGVQVGAAADVYGFGKTCCYALFQTAAPLRRHWQQVPDGLAELLEDCLHESPGQRMADFAQVLRRLAEAQRPPAEPQSVHADQLLPPPVPVAQPYSPPVARAVPVAIPQARPATERDFAEERRRREDERRWRERRPPQKRQSFRVLHFLFGGVFAGAVGYLLVVGLATEQEFPQMLPWIVGVSAGVGAVSLAIVNSRWGVAMLIGAAAVGAAIGYAIVGNAPPSGHTPQVAVRIADTITLTGKERFALGVASGFALLLMGFAVLVVTPVKLLVAFVQMLVAQK